MIMEDTKRVSHLWKPTAVEPLYEHAIEISSFLFKISFAWLNSSELWSPFLTELHC